MVKCLKYFDQDLVNPASAGENLARDIIRASFSQERMTYFSEDSKVVYRSKIPSLAGMRILAFIEDEDVIKKILKHLSMWAIKARPPPKRANGPPLNIHYETDSNLDSPLAIFRYSWRGSMEDSQTV